MNSAEGFALSAIHFKGTTDRKETVLQNQHISLDMGKQPSLVHTSHNELSLCISQVLS